MDAVLRDGTSEVVNTLQLKDVYMVDGATVMMSYGIDGLPVTVISPATDARKVMRFPNLQGIKSIRFDPIGSTQHLAAAGKHRGVNAGSFSGQRGSDAMSQAPANVEYFAAHQGEIRKVTSERERQDIANGDTRGAAALESSYQAALAATNQYLATKSAAAKAESTDPCWSTKLTLAQIAYGMANWSATDAAGYAAFRSRAMAIAGAYVPATVSYVRQLLEGANESEQHAAEIFLALDSAAKSSDVPANSAADALELQGEAMGHVHGCSPRP